MVNRSSDSGKSYLQEFCDRVSAAVMKMSDEDAEALAADLEMEDVSAMRTNLCDALITRGLAMRAEKKASSFYECCNKDFILRNTLSGGMNIRSLPLWRTVLDKKRERK